MILTFRGRACPELISGCRDPHFQRTNKGMPEQVRQSHSKLVTSPNQPPLTLNPLFSGALFDFVSY